ncbi:ABC-three component system protein [Geodermatophilus amargosae]
MADDTYPLSGASRKSREAVASLVETSDLGFVDSAPIHDVLEVHSRTRYHSQRFSTPLADRPPCEPPPSEIDEGELRYVSQLVEVYNEHFKGIGVHVGNVAHASKCATHFQRQRESFYAAEALRRFARDQVPPGTYEHLQENIYQGVVETAEMPHADGYVRLQTVLQLSMSIDVSSNRLMQVLDKADCKGICHQLANEDRLRWVTQDD